MKRDVFPKVRAIPAACCLVIALVFLAAPAMAATTQVNVTKYCDNNYSVAAKTANLTVADLMADYTQVYSNGPLHMQKGTFDLNDTWGDANQGMVYYGEHNGTYVSNITGEVGGMSDGDELWVIGIDKPITRYFGYDNVYTPNSRQGDMILAWWDNETGLAGNTWNSGLCLFFYTPPSVYGFADSLNLTNRDMEASFDSWYQRFVPDKYNVSALYPAANGLSVKNVTDLLIYPPHRYDFNTTGDTTEWAYEKQVNGVPTSATVPSTAFSSTSEIADDDGTSYSKLTTADGYSAAQRFVFNVTESAADIEKLGVTWIGTGTHTGGTNGADLYIWNGSSYELLQSSTGSTEVTLTGEKTSSISNYINGGNVTVLVKQKGTADEGAGSSSTLATDYVKLVVTHHHSNS